jgi:Bacteriophage head to tail connecting protein
MAGTALALNFDETDARQISSAEAEVVQEIMREFTEMQIWRNTYALQLEETAQLIWPEYRNTFYYAGFTWPGTKRTQQQVDATGMLALHRFAAISDSLLTPADAEWHRLSADDEYVMKDRATRLWFDQLTRLLFKYRYNPHANFRGQNNSRWRSLGAFGNATILTDAFDGRLYHGLRGLRYRHVPLGETFFRENHQGSVDGVTRWFRLTAHQAAQKWGDAALPAQLRTARKSGSQWPFNFLHCVRPRLDFDRERMDARGMPFSSHYVSIEGQCLMQEEGGYRTFPYAISRYDVAPREVYGRGPAQMILPSLKTLNAQKATFLKQGHRAADPVLLTSDDGAIGMDLRPGALNKGGVDAQGRELVKILPTGNIAIAKEMLLEERGLIDDMFLVSLFKVLSEHPSMTATQVIELVNEKGMLVAPTLGQQETTLSLQIEREIDVLNAQGLLPPIPPRLREARGSFHVIYTSPLAMTRKASAAAGFLRTLETSKEVVNITGDPSHLDWANLDVALPEIARNQGTYEHWIHSDRDVAQMRQNRAQQQQQEMQIKALPNQAAMISAQAKMAKAQPGVAPGTPGFGGPQQPQPGAPA